MPGYAIVKYPLPWPRVIALGHIELIMTLYHATTCQALPSIMVQGLLTGKARADAKIRGVWLHTASKTPWAILHTQRRHRVALADVVVIEVRISRYARRSGTLRRFQRGVWYSVRDITVTQLGRVHDATQWAQGVCKQ